MKTISPRKQRRRARNAPLHKKQKMAHAKVSKEGRKLYGKKLQLRKGDEVIVMRGDFKGIKGKVEKVDLKKSTAFVSGVELIKNDGSKVKRPIHVSNLLIINPNTNDSKRFNKKTTKSSEKVKNK